MDEAIFPYMGGIILMKPQGQATITDEMTGQPKTIVWPDHMQIQAGKRVAKLTRAQVLAIIDLYKKDADFRKKVEEIA